MITRCGGELQISIKERPPLEDSLRGSSSHKPLLAQAFPRAEGLPVGELPATWEWPDVLLTSSGASGIISIVHLQTKSYPEANMLGDDVQVSPTPGPKKPLASLTTSHTAQIHAFL